MSVLHLLYDGYGREWPNHGPFNPSDLCGTPPGLSGTELPMFGMAFELARMGHEVSIYSRFTRGYSDYPKTYIGNGEGFIDSRHRLIQFRDLDAAKDGCDIAIAFHDGRRLDGWPAKLKVCHHQTFLVSNRQQDATYTGADFADIYITATARVARHLERAYGWPKVHVVPNAWDLGEYQPWDPIPGRIIYTTSLERGFRRLLEVFPEIRERVPDAHIVTFERGGPVVDWLKANPVDGVTLVKASSRNAVLAEVARASVFAYPCDPPAPTEVFPLSILEACATGLPVVLAPADGLEELVADGVLLTPPIQDGGPKEPFVNAVVDMLTDEEAAAEQSERGEKWSAPYTFANTTRILAEVLGL